MRKYSIPALAIVLAFFGLFLIAQSVIARGNLQDDLIAHGKYIATIAGCTSCHTPYKAEYLKPPQELTPEQIQILAFNERQAHDTDKLLAGGRLFDLGPAGQIFTRNLTPDQSTGIGAWTDDQIKTAVKSGKTPSNEVLFPIMPYHTYNSMADADLDAVIAYLHSVKAVSNAEPQDTVSKQGLQAIPFKSGISAPDPSDKAGRGAYLVNSVVTCTDCHTPVDPATGAPLMDKYLAGGQPYEGPWGIVYGGNITPDKGTGLGDWSEAEIKRALLSGIRKDGRRLILMPWYAYNALTEADADAIVYYLKNGLPAVKNEVPASALNQAFVVMAPESENPKPANNVFLQPVTLVIVGAGIVLLVTVILMMLRRKMQ